ncbi:MAG: hypothetical protein AAGF74_18975 [Pseudomonadota bacterium]
MTNRSIPRTANLLLAGSTLVAALFVAIQAWYARVTYVEQSQSRLLQEKLDLCFDNFDAAAALDQSLRSAAPGLDMQAQWPPEISVETGFELSRLQREVVPRLDDLESGLLKASILGPLDKYRAYLAQELSGLSKRLLDVAPGRLGEEAMDREVNAVFATLSEFLGAQYSVFTGCRLVAEGTA